MSDLEIVEQRETRYVFSVIGDAASQCFIGLGVILLVAAAVTYGVSEVAWSHAGKPAGLVGESWSVSVGESTYSAISFLRSIALGVIGCGCVVLGTAIRRHQLREEEIH